MIHSQSYYPVRTDVLQQALSKWFIPNPITQLELMFLSSRPLKTLRFLKFSEVREKEL